MIRISYVYGLQDPRNGQLRYVGKSNNVDKRLCQHIHRAKSGTDTPVKEWLRELLVENYQPEVFIIEEVPIQDVYAAEDFWWQYFRYIGADLLNCFRPLDGPLYHREAIVRKVAEFHRGKHRSEQTKERISRAATRRFADSGNHPMYGKPRPQSTREKVSRTRIEKGVASGKNNPMWGETHSEETRKLISQKVLEWHKNHNHPNLGRPMDEEQKRKLSEVHKGKKLSLEHKKKIGQSLKEGYASGQFSPPRGMLGKKHSREACEKIVEANEGKAMSDSARQKMCEIRAKILPCKYGCGFEGTQAERANHIRWKHCIQPLEAV